MKRRIFVSHGSKDFDVTNLLAHFFTDTFVQQSSGDVFCSSIRGRELAAGDNDRKILRGIIEEVGVVLSFSRERIQCLLFSYLFSYC